MQIPPISPFDSAHWNTIQNAFHQVPSLEFGQAWLDSPSDNFRPAQVKLGWNQDAFLVFASLVDDCLFTEMTADNQKAWELGDTFELFIKDPTRPDYFEFHVTPNRHRLQLHFPDAQAIIKIRDKLSDHQPFLVNEPLFDYSVRTVAHGWEISLQIPATSIIPNATFSSESQLLASFSRYDYDDKGSPPVISSTSLHKVLGFHRQEEWSLLHFST